MTKKTKQKTRKSKKNPDNLYQRAGIWWIRYSVNGQKIRASLGTTNLREAKQLRDELLAQRSARARLGLPPIKPSTPEKTVGEVSKLLQRLRE